MDSFATACTLLALGINALLVVGVQGGLNVHRPINQLDLVVVNIATKWREVILWTTTGRFHGSEPLSVVCVGVLLLKFIVQLLEEYLSLTALDLLVAIEEPSDDLLVLELHITLKG
jgi:hypothetical protein